jgi:protein-S-isoprenylcysteine O-methyltransferase Ste14
MLIAEVIIVIAAIVIATRTQPPTRQTSPRTLSALASVAIITFGVALGAIVIVNSTIVFSVALLVAGLTAALFLWLVRTPEEDDWDEGDEPPDAEPPTEPDGDARRFKKKRTRTTGPRTRAPRD